MPKSFVLLLIFSLLKFSLAFAQEEQPFTYTDKDRRDPFLPLVDKNGRYLLDTGELYSSSELNLSGILWDPQGKSSAIINNQIVNIGESIYGFEIRNITKDSITIFKDDKEYIIRLTPEEE